MVWNKINLKFILFCVVGGVGFIVDAVVLLAAINLLHLGPLFGRVISFIAAVFTTWLLNRNLTFNTTKTDKVYREGVKYFSVSIFGALVNYSVYAACILLSPLMYRFPVLALMIASLAGLVVNYTLYQKWIFVSRG